jgi:methyl-accepting chemotaxis protein
MAATTTQRRKSDRSTSSSDEVSASEIELRAQIDAIDRSQAVIEYDLDGTIRAANDNFLQLVDYQLDQLAGQHHRVLTHEGSDDRSSSRELWDQLRAGGYEAGRFQLRTSGDRVVWVRASFNAILDADGEPSKVVMYANDVTEAVENARRASMFASMVDNAPFNMMLVDLDLKLQYLNPASIESLRQIESALPVTVDQMVGTSIDVFHKDPQHQRDLLADPANLPYKATIKVGDDDIDLLASAIYDGTGQHVGSMACWSIVTKRMLILEAIEAAASGDLTQHIEIEDDDAFGRTSKAVRQLIDNLRASIGQIAATADRLAGASDQLGEVSSGMSSTAEETSSQANVVAAAAEEVSANVATVASASEQMSASIKEIAMNSSSAAEVAAKAVDVATETGATVSKLGESSSEIGQIVKVITSIAQQTNLLALNATIEAARAGEVGKGFAVVANEVKELAKATARATEDISQKIQAIQTDTGSVVEAIDSINGIINQISSIQTTIASAVEEQAATTSEIGRNVSEAARGSSEIAENITHVAGAAASTSSGAKQSNDSAAELSSIARDLKELVGKFKI